MGELGGCEGGLDLGWRLHVEHLEALEGVEEERAGYMEETSCDESEDEGEDESDGEAPSAPAPAPAPAPARAGKRKALPPPTRPLDSSDEDGPSLHAPARVGRGRGAKPAAKSARPSAKPAAAKKRQRR